ncbi:MAG TPA: LPS assembly protein LptD [Bryobacteraceae bacterium]|nr:LPS assembly protein LptD [Bryobacteraceae bacterium]
MALPSIPNLGPRPEFPNWSSTTASILSTTFGEICHELYAPAITLLLLSVLPLGAQIFTPPLPGAPQTAQPSGNPNHRAAPPRPNIPGKDEIHIETSLPSGQEKIGHVYHLRGDVRIETTDELLKADEVDYDEESGDAEARGHVHFEHFARGEKLDCDRAEYNFDSEEGKFYNVSGSSPSQVQARPGLLTTQNPFYFQAKWAERLNGHYILYSGFVTDCIVPRPWWRLRGPKFDLIPGDRAVTRDSWFYLKSLPLFYTPYFYKSLKKVPRRSGFLLPNTANSSLHGRGIGLGYFWAINRSFDLTYRAQYFSQAGLGNHAELRGKINQKTDFDLWVDGIKDQQTPDPGDSGFRIRMIAKSQLGDGWEARGSLDYLSNFAFVQSFTQSFYEAVSSQSESVGFATKHWSDFGLTIAATRDVNFQSTAPGDTIEVRKLPEIDFTEREHEIDLDKFPVWFSFDSTAGLLDRSQPLFQTHQFVQRIDLAPHVTTAFHWHDFSLVPTFGIRETEYGESVATQAIDGGQGVQPPGPISVDNLIRSSRDLQVELIFPSLERIFKPPKWMGDKVKHVIEPRIVYKYVNGVDNFNDIVRFDESDILTNTNQLELSVTNHLLSKDKNGTVVDFLSWQVRYDRYFDPSFGGVVQTPIAGQTPQRYVIDASSDLTGFAFIDGPRNYSPIVSVVRIQPGPQPINFEWRTDYDPMFHRLTNSSVSVDGRIKKYFWGVTHTDINTDPALTPRANQIGTRFGYGNPNSRGWNFGGTLNYDYLKGQTLFWEAQATKNTDCCGFSVQYRRIAVGLRGESVIEGAFAISNIGTFGSLKRQDSIF